MSTTPKNGFRRVVDLDAASAFLDGSKTSQVAAMDRAAGEGAPPVVEPHPAIAPAPPVVHVQAADIDKVVDAEVQYETPPLRAMEAAAAPKPLEAARLAQPLAAPNVEIILRPDGTPTDSHVLKQVNFKMTEPNFWRVKDFVDSTPRLTMQRFLEEAAVEKMLRMQAAKK